MKKPQIDGIFFSRLIGLLRRLFNPKTESNLIIVYFLLLLFSVIVEICIWKVGLMLSNYQSILLHRDSNGFVYLTIVGVLLLIVAGISKSIKHAMAGWFELRCIHD